MFTFIETYDTVKDCDVLFWVDPDHRVARVTRSIPTIRSDRVLEGSVQLPREIVNRIVFYHFLNHLRIKEFEEAFKIISFTREMIHRIYYGVYGWSDKSLLVKIDRLGKTFRLIAAIHHEFLADHATMYNFPVVVLDYKKDFVLQPKTKFYPWQFYPYVSVVDIAGYTDLGKYMYLGKEFLDRAILVNPKYRNGYTYAENLIYPFIHIMPMDRLKSLNIFADPDVYYHFARFTMLLRAIYGIHTKTFFFESADPGELTDETVFELRHYHFMDVASVKRR